MIEILIFGPLLGSLIAGFMYRSIGENVATILATSIVIIGAIISWFVFLDIVSGQWFCCSLRLDNIWVIKLPMGCKGRQFSQSDVGSSLKCFLFSTFVFIRIYAPRP